jgi:hypothetical protein
VTALTDTDRLAITRAGKLGPALRASSGNRDRLAGWLLAELVGIIERLDSGEGQAPEDAAIDQIFGSGTDTRRLGEIRALLARFDWEHDDRQLALEAIERITEGETDGG